MKHYGRCLALFLMGALLLAGCDDGGETPIEDTGVDAGQDDARRDRDAEDVGTDPVEDESGTDTGRDSDSDGDATNDDLDATPGDADAVPDADATDSGGEDSDVVDDSQDTGEDAQADPDLPVDEPDAIAPALRFEAPFTDPLNLTTNATIGSGEVVFPAAIGGVPPYRYTAAPLPTGVLFSETQRAFRGTPTVASTTRTTYRAEDSRGTTGHVTFDVVVGADVFGPNPPTELQYVDHEDGPTALRPPDFGFEWRQSSSPDVERQLIYLYPAGGSAEGGEPVADLPGDAGSATLTRLLDSHGDCLALETEYIAEWVLFDELGNRSPALDATEAERAVFRLAFTSSGEDINNRIVNVRFISTVASWASRASGDGGTPSAQLSWDGSRDAGECIGNGSLHLTNDSDAGSDVRGGTEAVAFQCLEAPARRTYGFSADVLVPPDQPREGAVFLSVVWYPEADCTGIPEGNSASSFIEVTDGWELLAVEGARSPNLAVSAEFQLVVVKNSPNDDEADDNPFEAWFDNVVFGRFE